MHSADFLIKQIIMKNSYLSSVLAYSLILLPCRSYIYYDECTNPLILMLEIPHIVSSHNIFIPISVIPFRKVLKSFSFIYNCLPLLILYFLNPFLGYFKGWPADQCPSPISPPWLWSQQRLMSSLGVFENVLYETIFLHCLPPFHSRYQQLFVI